MKKLLALFILFALVACEKNPSLPEDSSSQTDPALKGVWKMASVRYAGGRVPNMNDMYAIADPENNDIALFSAVEQEDGGQYPVMDMLKLATDGDDILLINSLDYEKFLDNPKGEFVKARIPYDLLQDNDLHLYPEAVGLIPDEMVSQEPEIKNLHMEFLRDTEIEAIAGTDTKADDQWMERVTQALIQKVWTSVGKDGIDEENDFVTSKTWANSQGWKPENWMSNLPDDMPVAWVNIPGSHDSSTTEDNMNFIADWTDAWVQTYTIEEQYKKGARYFDFRVGSTLVSCWLGLAERTMNEKERAAVNDLQMYHGPLCTNTPFIGTMRKLAETIRKDKTEFIIINVQAERESNGLSDTIFYEIWDSIFDDGSKAEFYNAVSEQTMDVANRLMKKFSREYGDDIFIPYSMDLTVGEARGHIIIMESDAHRHYQCHFYYLADDGTMHDENWLRASFLSGWPDNKDGFATIYTYSKADSLYRNMYVQSYYEMGTDNTTKITRKEESISSLMSNVSGYNNDPNHINVLGFNAMNANTGSATGLVTYAFAHEFNGYAFEAYVDYMKSSSNIENPLRCGIVPMDHYGASIFDDDEDVKVYGDKLSWAVIESNFYNR